MTSSTHPLKAKTIAIIGAGPSGVIAAKYLLAEKAFDKIVLYEQRSRSGGIWNYTANQRNEDLFTIPQTDPRGNNQDPDWIDTSANDNTHATNGVNGHQKKPSFLSPMYEKLETNIPRGLMGFQDLDWPSDSQLFPPHETVLAYIDTYTTDINHLIHYSTQVINCQPTSSFPNTSWTVRTRDIQSNQEQEEVLDAVVVANGHFITPNIPAIPGIKEWNEKYPGAITHSKYYRHASDYTSKKVIVIGNSASGNDISAQISTCSALPVLWSNRSISMFSAAPGTIDKQRRDVPPIAQFLPEQRGVEFEDGSVEVDVDAVVFATGYFYSLPFLENVEPRLITDGSHVNHTYQHIFFAPQPTLSFLALNQRVIPFSLAAAQAAVVARVYSGRLTLPPLSIMEEWEKEIKLENGDGKNFHLLIFPKDGNYINAMSQWALSAPLKEGLENEGKGKVPPVWGEWEFWCRENFPAVRKAFVGFGEERKSKRTLEDVGFDFGKWKREKEKVEGKMI
jgi:cation diffusion facilitator CzcD-associated flavoprotein CzcO